MPAKRFICPNGDEINMYECLLRCPQGTRCMFLPTLRAVATSLERNLTKPSVTELLSGTRELYLKKITEYAVNPQKQLYALHGSAVHTITERHTSGNMLSEERLKNTTTTGQFDLYGQVLSNTDTTLGDLKITSSYNDMYPLYWTTSKGGIFMRYSYEFKRKAIELFYQGEWPKTPNGVRTDTFHRLIRDWVKLEQLHGSAINKSRGANKYWSPEEKYELVCQVLSGQGLRAVAIVAGINSGQLYQWVHKYKTLGYNGLINKSKGRPPKDCKMKVTKTISPRKLKESEYEELIRLRAEIAYIKAENEVIKKEIALREEKEAARLKAKKQRLLKRSESKDIN